MAISTNDEINLKSLENIIGYFDQQVLAAYQNEPDKYRIESDYFEGRLRVTNEHYDRLESQGKAGETIDIRFGYRTLRNGNLAIVVWLPDLFEKSKSHIPKWSAFHLRNPEWTPDCDERFRNWVLRYIAGSWEVDNGPLYYLAETLKTTNSLTIELVGIPLYIHELDETLGYPSAENTHRYQDCHKKLYGYLIDGLSKDCIARLAVKFGKNIKIGEKKTIDAVTKLFPTLETTGSFTPAMDLVSEQRRLASHGVRPPAESFHAFSQFTKDLSLCLKGVKELLEILECESGVYGEEARKHYEAKRWLPKIVRPPMAHFSIVEASKMKGKTVEKVEFGFRKGIEGVHDSEALIIYFTDGSIMGLDTGSNALNLSNNENGLRPEDFHVDLKVQWVPELRKT
jgi:hypothetical protein